MQAGDIMIVPPNAPHEFVFMEDTPVTADAGSKSKDRLLVPPMQ
jgi:hypothetical protein